LRAAPLRLCHNVGTIAAFQTHRATNARQWVDDQTNPDFFHENHMQINLLKKKPNVTRQQLVILRNNP